MRNSVTFSLKVEVERLPETIDSKCVLNEIPSGGRSCKTYVN